METWEDLLRLLTIMAIIQAFACAFFSDTVAKKKGHSGGAWFFAGLLFGPLALVAAAGLPDRLYHSRNESLTRPSTNSEINKETGSQ